MGEAATKEEPWRRDPGATLLDGKYRLEEPIGAGGMGTVWRAVHVTLERLVAVKFVRADGERAVERFLREAKIAAAIRSPYVVDMLDFGTSPTGDPFIVMELLEGEALDERLVREPLPTREAVRMMSQLLVGLDAVHRAGIVHRDLKPANVFLSNDGSGDTFARLIDFGISHSLDPSSSLRRGQHGTDDRLVVGTPEYIAPEQAEGRPDVDARADVYAAGVMMYEMLSGVVPFDAEHPGKILYKVMNGAHTALVELRPDIPELSEVIEGALSRDPDHRPQSARDLRRQLLSAAGLIGEVSGSFVALRRSTPPAMTVEERTRPTIEPIPPSPPPTPAPSSRRGWLAASAAVVVVVAIAAAAFAVLGDEAPLPAPAPAVVVAPPVALPAPPAPSAAPPPSTVAPPPLTPEATPAPEAVAAETTPSPRARARAPRSATPESHPAPTTAEPSSPGALHRELDF